MVYVLITRFRRHQLPGSYEQRVLNYCDRRYKTQIRLQHNPELNLLAFIVVEEHFSLQDAHIKSGNVAFDYLILRMQMI